MPDNRKHRGPHPADAKLFDQSEWPKLQQAVRDLSWLFSQGYKEKSALKLVGDRYRLKGRQRMAVVRSSCSHQAALHRSTTHLNKEQLSGKVLHIDGFNVLISIESALSNSFLLEGVDGCYRDLASIHGSYKRVSETAESIILIGKSLESLKLSQSIWYFDKPVSNSGRLKSLVLDIGQQYNWNHRVELNYNPDKVLIDIGEPVASSDSVVLDKTDHWFNFVRFVVDYYIRETTVLPLSKYIK